MWNLFDYLTRRRKCIHWRERGKKGGGGGELITGRTTEAVKNCRHWSSLICNLMLSHPSQSVLLNAYFMFAKWVQRYWIFFWEMVFCIHCLLVGLGPFLWCFVVAAARPFDGWCYTWCGQQSTKPFMSPWVWINVEMCVFSERCIFCTIWVWWIFFPFSLWSLETNWQIACGGVGVTASHFGVDDLVYVSLKWPWELEHCTLWSQWCMNLISNLCSHAFSKLTRLGFDLNLRVFGINQNALLECYTIWNIKR